MMGPMKASAIRAELRRAFKMPDAELLEWFNRQLTNLPHERNVNQTEMESLRLLRDALVKEIKRPAPRRQSRRAAS